MRKISTLYPDLSLTNFPDSVDTFVNYLNITATDGPLIKQYIEAMNAGNQILANQILAQIPAASQKLIKATDLNKLTQGILAVERFYNDNIQGYIQQAQEEWNNIINSFSYQGTWSSVQSYVQNNIVEYTSAGYTMLYLAISDVPIGTFPTSTRYWRVLTIKGEQGASGVGLAYRGEWNTTTSYNANEAVTYGGAIWMSIQSSTNIEPGTNEEYWKVIIQANVATYPIQSTVPSSQETGELWFNTSDAPTDYYYLETLSNPALQENILSGFQAYNDSGEMIVGTATTSNYTQGNGININENTISVLLSQDENNEITYGSDNGIFYSSKIQTGSYVGTGQYCQSNQNSITFNFNPKVVFISCQESSDFSGPLIQGMSSGGMTSGDTTGSKGFKISLIWEENKLSWYHNTVSRSQLNTLSNNYFYIAFG